ncbi:hypothetical protein M2T79_18445 [Elizabethkingia miricola]|uniref:hypothetical protein n=1 Tax=Elizabethkingia miricola TaxID=172045 RepID=UPI0020184591|nr:hypothetical protein [Elizabethkingia miricola]MCL1658590.1 hypothetical protein [Elizabethkingia miricola]
MRTYLKIFLAIVAFALSVILKLNYSEVFMNTLYTVLGIMFSIGLGLVVTFNLSGVKNRQFVISIRNNLKELRSLYISYFTISTFFYLIESQLRAKNNNIIHVFENSKIKLEFDFSTLTVCLLFYSIIYCIINMIDLQKLSESIFDETNK